jgi:sarcosine oxidase delta subunit
MLEFGNNSVVASKKEIIEELLFCRENKAAIGIWSHSLGKGMFMCLVKEVVMDEDEDDIVVILNENDLHGSNVETHVLYLYEIDKIYRFRVVPSPTLRVRSADDDQL